MVGRVEGTPFGRYRLQQLIGRGGMGEVWRAYDTETERDVALKLLPAQFAHDEEFIGRFRREARVAAGLNNPNVVPIHHFGEIGGTLYVDMQVIAGRDLQALLAAGPLPAGRAVRIVEQVASALRAAHAAGLVHRDVKPSNVLITADDFAYLIDFGLARSSEDDGLTVTGHTVGTFAYMAPERYEGGQVDARTDVYSLACVLYQCLTGQRPFAGSGAQQMMAHLTVPPPRPSDVMPQLGRGFDEVIARGMAKDVRARYQRIEELAGAARAALDSPAVAAGFQAPPRGYDQSYPPTQPTVPGRGGPPTQAWVRQPQSQPPPPQQAAFVPMPVVVKKSWWRRKPVVIGTALLCVVAIAVTAVVLTTSGGAPPAPALPDGAVTVAGATYLPQEKVNTDGMSSIRSLTTNANGTLLGLCCAQSMFSIAKDKAPKVSPLTLGRGMGPGLAVDDLGNGYLATSDGAVLKLDGSLKETVLPFPPTFNALAIAVDTAGDVFVRRYSAAYGDPAAVNEVLKLPFGAQASVALPFGKISGVNMAVAPDGTAYVDDPNSNRILKLGPDDQRPTPLSLPRQEGSNASVTPRGLAADADGAVYLAAQGVDGNLIYKYAPGEQTAEPLPITGMEWDGGTTVGLAVDAVGNVFAVSQERDNIAKLPRYRE